MQLLRTIRFDHIRKGPYAHPSNGVEAIKWNLTDLISDPGFSHLHSLRLHSHYDKYDDNGNNSPWARRQRRLRPAPFYATRILGRYESPIERASRNDKKLILLCMRRDMLLWAATIAENTLLKVLVEEVPSKQHAELHHEANDTRCYKPAWLAVAIRLAKTNTHPARLKPHAREVPPPPPPQQKQPPQTDSPTA
jgi:hypothetical protein